ncbi:Transmembrane gamma-carboxyglutamic acid protein 3 [Cricetulus griseus]|uniref:Transmembrane gamma-carboxyglutamic acid protein 3 n=1 Tax=Cricetulus griseus TaxID=10029 RepID=G3I4B0_CRIGR|nr:Transmembrane gamma-carboxyglutamic acid protein 3 [Cricetulus griseus]
MVEPKNKLEPVDIEFEVGSEFLLSDSQEEQFFSEHGECNDDNVKKSLEEETGFNLKEHVIDETPGSSSDEDYCVIVEDTEDEKGPKIPEVIVDQGQRHQKTVETAPKGPSTVVQPVRPEAVVEPMEMEREQCEYELAQHTDTLCNLPYEQPMVQQQLEQGQENLVYQPREQMEFWKGYPNAVYSVRDPAQSSDAMYVVVPLLGVVLLIVIALFIIWRCQLQKATHHYPSYAQNRYLASRTGHNLPRVMVYRGTVHSQGESSGHREAGNNPQIVVGPSRGGRTTVRLESTLYLPELSLSRLSSATPPPSYEEVTAPQEGSSEEASVSYSDPPPKYEEIVAGSPSADK